MRFIWVIFSIAMFAGGVIADEKTPHAHGKLLVEENLDRVRLMSESLLKDIFKNLGGETEEAAIKEKARTAAVKLYEGMKGVPEFQSYTKRIPQFDTVIFKGTEKTDKFNAFFFGGKNKTGKCQLVNSLLISEAMVSLLTEEELMLLMSHELVHLIKGHKCLDSAKRIAFYHGEIVKVLDDEKEIDAAGGEAAFLRMRFPKLHEGGGFIAPGSAAHEALVKDARVFTSEIEADEGEVLILGRVAKFKVEPVVKSFYEKMAKVQNEPLACEGKGAEYTYGDYFDSIKRNPRSPEGTLHPPLCVRYNHLNQELSAHGLEP